MPCERLAMDLLAADASSTRAAFCWVIWSSCPTRAVDLLDTGQLLLAAGGQLRDDVADFLHRADDRLQGLSGLGNQ